MSKNPTTPNESISDNSVEDDCNTSVELEEIIAIGKHKTSWQQIVLLISASLSVIIVLLIFIFTFINGFQIIPEYGLFKFLFGDFWNPEIEYGILPMIIGSFLVVLIALVIAIPVGIACAVFLAELAPDIVRKIMKPTIELLASIPSIVYGFIALRTIVIFFQDVLGFKTGRTAFTAGIVLAIMILPTIISIADDAIKAVPQIYKEGSLALGATRWQTIRKVILPASVSGLTAAIILGFGRAIGETMAIYIIGGGATAIPKPFFNIFQPIDTLTSVIVRELGEAAVGSTEYHAIFAVACVLFIITL